MCITFRIFSLLLLRLVPLSLHPALIYLCLFPLALLRFLSLSPRSYYIVNKPPAAMDEDYDLPGSVVVEEALHALQVSTSVCI